MYIHASSGKWYHDSHRFSNRNEHLDDHYLIGPLRWRDRLAVARITVRGDEAIHRQNVRLYPSLLVLTLVTIVVLWTAAAMTNFILLIVLAIFMTVFGIIGNFMFFLEDSVDVYRPNVSSHATSVKIAVWWLTHGTRRHRLLPVSESRTLRLLATGQGNSSGNTNTDNSAVYCWFQINGYLKPEIDALLLDPEVSEIELLLKNRPSAPTDDDREAVNSLKRQLDDKVTAFKATIAIRETERRAAEEAEAARVQAETDRLAQHMADEEIARNDSWRQRTARVLNIPEE